MRKNIISHGGHLKIQNGPLLNAIFHIEIDNMVLDTKPISVRTVGSSVLLFLTTSFHYSHLEPNKVV